MNPFSQLKFSAIVAMDKNGLIGNNNRLPWHLPADLKYFKATTTGHAVIMGRKTYESIGKPLPNRTNFILTRNLHYQAPGCHTIHRLEDFTQFTDLGELFVIGGADIYQQSLAYIQKIYITLIHHAFEGDTYFPLLEKSEWHEISRENHDSDENNAYPYSFIIWERKHNIRSK